MNPSKSCDLLLCGGHVIDPANAISCKMDVAVTNGRIAAVGNHLDLQAAKTVHAEDCYVTPGLIDMHCHIYPRFPFDADSLPNLNADAHCPASGVTTAVDAGTCGWRDFMRFKQEVIDVSHVRVLAFLNIACGGMVSLSSEQTPTDFHPRVVAAVTDTFPDLIVGIKAAHYWGDKPFDQAHPPWASVDSGRTAAELCGKPLMVDFKVNLPDCSYEELVLEKLRSGDIHTHMYAQQFPVVDANGKVNDFLFAARRRGVHFDLGHGAGSFWFRNAIPAFKGGFAPDTLSSDLYMGNIRGPVVSLLHIMSKYINIGMPLEDVIARVTTHAAKAIRHTELGTLNVGSSADIAVLREISGPYHFADCGNASMRGHSRLECMLTLRDGNPLFDPFGMTMPDWESAPAAYWQSPGIL